MNPILLSTEDSHKKCSRQLALAVQLSEDGINLRISPPLPLKTLLSLSVIPSSVSKAKV